MPAGPEKERKQKQRGADLATQRDAFSLEAASLLDPAAGPKPRPTPTRGRGPAGGASGDAPRLGHGPIWIGDSPPYLPQAEWGGMKQSGIGRELGLHGLGEYQETKHIYHNTAPAVTGWFGDDQ